MDIFLTYSSIQVLIYILGANDLLNEHITTYENYTGDGKWGMEGVQFGIRGQMWFYTLYSILGFGLFLIYKRFSFLRNNFVSAITIISIITLLNAREFYTFSERLGIISLLSCTTIFAILDSKSLLSKINTRIVTTLVILSFITSVSVFVQPRDSMFINMDKGYDVSIRSCFIPTAICILDLHHIGYSDEYLKQNGRNRHK